MGQDNAAIIATRTAAIAEEQTTGMPRLSMSDLPLGIAASAHRGTSFVPDDRAIGEQAGYVDEMIGLWKSMHRYATEENAAERVAAWEGYRQSYLSQTRALLASRSRLVSTMIAGASAFPAHQMNKRSEAHDRKVQAFLHWREKALNAIQKQFAPNDNAPIKSSDPNALESLQAKLQRLEALQVRMVAANKCVRKQDRDGLARLGFSDEEIAKLLDATKFGGPGFASFDLSNNRAEIKRLQGRIVEVQRTQAQAATFAPMSGDGWEISEADGRLCIVFDGKPDAQTIAALKSRGFRWAPSRTAWVRQFTPNAVAAARAIVEG